MELVENINRYPVKNTVMNHMITQQKQKQLQHLIIKTLRNLTSKVEKEQSWRPIDKNMKPVAGLETGV